MADESTPHVQIGMREIYDTLILLREDVRLVQQAATAERERASDHEIRIRSLERWKYGIPLAGVAALVTGALALFRT